jgi:hypothetical protein
MAGMSRPPERFLNERSLSQTLFVYLIAVLVIPIQGLMKDFRSCGVKVPSKLDFDILHQVTCQFDMPDICRVPLGGNVIVLQDSGSIEI